MSHPSPDHRAALDQIVRRLEAAWNAGDGEAFSTPFAEDADFVNIRGEHHSGRLAIGVGHDAIFRTIYAGSTNRMTLEAARLLRPEVVRRACPPRSMCPGVPWPAGIGRGLRWY